MVPGAWGYPFSITHRSRAWVPVILLLFFWVVELGQLPQHKVCFCFLSVLIVLLNKEFCCNSFPFSRLLRLAEMIWKPFWTTFGFGVTGERESLLPVRGTFSSSNCSLALHGPTICRNMVMTCSCCTPKMCILLATENPRAFAASSCRLELPSQYSSLRSDPTTGDIVFGANGETSLHAQCNPLHLQKCSEAIEHHQLNYKMLDHFPRIQGICMIHLSIQLCLHFFTRLSALSNLSWTSSTICQVRLAKKPG